MYEYMHRVKYICNINYFSQSYKREFTTEYLCYYLNLYDV